MARETKTAERPPMKMKMTVRTRMRPETMLDFQGWGQYGPHLVDCPLDPLDHLEDVLATALQDCQGYTLLLVNPAAGKGVLVAVPDEGQIAEIYGFPVADEGDNGEDLRWVFEVLGHPDQVLALADVHAAAGHVDVAAFNGGDEAGKGDVVCGDAIQVKLDMDLPFQTAGNPSLEDSFDGLDAVLEIIGEGLESAQAEGPGENYPDDGDVREIHLSNNRFIREICGKIVISLLDLVPHLLERIVDVNLGQEFDGHGGEAFLRR
jgi:hypothetical protein